jgi:hypothetical protein
MAINWQFDMSAAERYDMDSDDVDAALEAANLTRETATIQQAQEACRKYAIEHHYNQPGLPPWI